MFLIHAVTIYMTVSYCEEIQPVMYFWYCNGIAKYHEKYFSKILRSSAAGKMETYI